MEYAVETFSLTKVFSDWWGRARVYAVDDLNLQIRPNEVYGLLGPNGSGKTTTLKMMLGLLHPTKGRALLLGGDSTDPRISAKIGFLPEESYLYRYLSARETLEFYGKIFGLPAKVRKMRIESLLEMVGLLSVTNRPVGTFSKGMARRIGLAQALINDPDLLILDEPTTGLDPIGTRQIKDLVIKLAERGKTILLCSHLLADVEDVCDRIAILYGGKVQAEGKVRDLLRQSDRRQINTGALTDSAVERIRKIVEAENADCEVTSPMDKLESFFIRTVAEAQQLDQPTSGAVSTTRIGDFLTEPAKPTDVLDELVTAEMTKEPAKPTAEEAATQQVTPAETPDEDLLGELTKQAEPAETTVVEPSPPPDEPRETPLTSSQQADLDVLDQLTKGSAWKSDTPDDETKEDGGDA